jgi:hypothetical protein
MNKPVRYVAFNKTGSILFCQEFKGQNKIIVYKKYSKTQFREFVKKFGKDFVKIVQPIDEEPTE